MPPFRACPSSASPAGVFRSDDRWLAIGDSITQHAGYQTAVLLYHATRFPGCPLPRAANAGIVGDSAEGALNRYDWDIAPSHATVATVMFGMNDVGQDLYDDSKPTPERALLRGTALDGYRDSLSRLVGRLRRDGIRPILASPTPFDETVRSDHPNRPGINTALAECTAIMRRLAAEQDCLFVDLHTPLTTLNARLQSSDPTSSIVGPDRIHPGPAGQLLIAYHLLKALGAPALVSEVEIDAKAGRVLSAKNATVTSCTVAPGELAFTVASRALPYPVLDDARDAAAWVPFHDDLNREILRVTGLAPGRHALLIDGVEIRRASATELAAGLNLAQEPATPQMRQALAAAALAEQWRQLVSLNLRRIALVEYWHLRELPRPIDFGSARPLLEAKLAATSPGLDTYTRTAIEGYLTVKPDEEKTRLRLAALLTQIQARCQPGPRAYRLVQVSDASDQER